jgi:hypothetical protein
MFAILNFLNSSANFKQSIFLIIQIFIIQTTFKEFDKIDKRSKTHLSQHEDHKIQNTIKIQKLQETSYPKHYL